MKLLPLFEGVYSEPIIPDDLLLKTLYDEGKKFYPKLTLRYTVLNGDSKQSLRFFFNYPKNKGSLSVEGLKNEITREKINRTVDWIVRKYSAKIVNHSLTTNSAYLRVGDKHIRVSDHKRKSFDGVDILITWMTDAKKLADEVKLLKSQNLFENTFDCQGIKITPEIAKEIAKYSSAEELLRAGGISNEALDRAAFGFTETDIKTLMPDQLKIKWKTDWANVKYEIEIAVKKGISKIQWAKTINLTEPIDVVFENGNFYVDDGHHRTYAAKILNKPLNVNLEIRDNPFKYLGVFDYDQYHKCAFKYVKENGEYNW